MCLSSEAMRDIYTRLAPAEKHRLIRSLGLAVRRCHDAGNYVSDLADIKVVGEGTGWGIFFSSSRRRRFFRLAKTQRRRIMALGGLLADCWFDTCRSERERFLSAYFLSEKKFGPLQRRRIETIAYRKLRLGWQGRVKRCFATNENFAAGREQGFRFHCDRALGVPALAALLPDPDQLLSAGEIYKPGTRTHAGRVTIGGEHRFLKRINYRGWRYGMSYLFRRSRAMHNWEIMWAFRCRRVPVADPILCLEERSFRFLKRSYILTDFARGMERLRVAWPHLTDAQRETLLIRLAGILGRMHRFGCLHGDLKWDNILVCPQGQRITLVDFDGSRIPCRPMVKRANKDIARFLKDLKAMDGSGCWTRLFLNSWQKWIHGI